MLYRLVVQRTPGGLVRVFLPRPPSAGGPPGEPVHLLELHPPTGRRFLGRHTADRRSYREFRSEAELLRAGYEPAGPYRVCGSWDEFLNPWATHEMNDQPTERMESEVGTTPPLNRFDGPRQHTTFCHLSSGPYY